MTCRTHGQLAKTARPWPPVGDDRRKIRTRRACDALGMVGPAPSGPTRQACPHARRRRGPPRSPLHPPWSRHAGPFLPTAHSTSPGCSPRSQARRPCARGRCRRDPECGARSGDRGGHWDVSPVGVLRRGHGPIPCQGVSLGRIVGAFLRARSPPWGDAVQGCSLRVSRPLPIAAVCQGALPLAKRAVRGCGAAGGSAMNTPAHLLVGLALCARRDVPRSGRWAALGGLLPDLSLYFLAGGALFVLQIPPERVFGELYFSRHGKRSLP